MASPSLNTSSRLALRHLGRQPGLAQPGDARDYHDLGRFLVRPRQFGEHRDGSFEIAGLGEHQRQMQPGERAPVRAAPANFRLSAWLRLSSAAS